MEIENAAINDQNGVSVPVLKYYKVLEKELHNEPENFHKLILLLQDFKNKRIDHIVTFLNLSELFKHKLHLVHGFKKLLNEVDCVERERTKAELAFLFACQVKDHFGNDQRFQTFATILTQFNMNEKTKTEVYREMEKLFGSRNKLFEKFSKFYGVTPETMPLPTEPAGGTPKNEDGREDCNKGAQDCNKSNSVHKKVNLVEPKLPCKRKRIQQEAGGSVKSDVRTGYANNEMDRTDKAKSSRGDRQAERERKGKAPVADDEIVPEHPKSGRDDLAQNDASVEVKGPNEEYVRYKNRCEQALFKLDDDRYEVDMLQGSVASAAERAKKLLKEIRRKKAQPSTLRLQDHFTALNLRCIESMYGDYGLEMIKILREDPAKALPVIIARLEEKKWELSIWKSHLDKIWRVSFDKLFRELQKLSLSVRT